MFSCCPCPGQIGPLCLRFRERSPASRLPPHLCREGSSGLFSKLGGESDQTESARRPGFFSEVAPSPLRQSCSACGQWRRRRRTSPVREQLGYSRFNLQ